MSQLAAGVVLFIIPGFLPAYVRYKSRNGNNRARLAVDALCFALVILTGTFGVLYAFFGDVLFSIRYNPYVLLYVSCFVGAYGFSFVLTMFAGAGGSGI